MSSKEYIEREAAIKCCTFGRTSLGLISELRKLPTADTVEVVRCKDCIHSVKGKIALECDKHRYAYDDINRLVNDEDFCCWGAKMDGGME